MNCEVERGSSSCAVPGSKLGFLRIVGTVQARKKVYRRWVYHNVKGDCIYLYLYHVKGANVEVLRCKMRP